MAQFDIDRNIGRHKSAIPYIVIVQSAFYDRTKRRMVVPLVDRDNLPDLPATPLKPVLTVDGRQVILNPLEIVTVPLDALGACVGQLAAEGDALVATLDELFSRA